MLLLRRCLVLVALAASSATADAAAAPTKVSLQLRWEPQFQFAGYYAALWQGYYREAGLEVEIRSAVRPDRTIRDAVEEVGAGRADFGVGAADILLGRERGLPLVVVASVFQESPAALYARASTRLGRPADLLGLRVARRPGDLIDVELEAMLRGEGIDPRGVAAVPFSAGLIDELAAGELDVLPGYRISAPHRFRERGLDFRELRPSSFGVAFYGDSLFAREALADADPGLVGRFREANLRGWTYALGHVEKVAARIARNLPQVEPRRDPFAYNVWQAGEVARLMLPDVVPIGHVNPARWGRMHRDLVRAGLATRPLALDRFIFDPGRDAKRRRALVTRLLNYSSAALLLTLLLMLLLILRWDEALRRRVRAATAELERAKRRLDDALESMADGLALYDAEERFVLCNASFRRLFPGSADLRVPGARLGDVWREEARRGIYADGGEEKTEAWIAARLARRDTGGYEIELADGRWLQFRSARTSDGSVIATARDVTERRRLERNLEHLATHDGLTGLPNRAMFRDELKRARARAERDGGRLAVMLVDLDRFKEVNDTHGHAVGDELLVEVARRLESALREGDLVARLGGDEFAIIAAGRPGGGSFAALAGRVVERLAEPVRLGGIELRPGGTVGLTAYPEDSGGPDQLLADADRALYAAKEAGRGTWAPYREDMRDGGGAEGPALGAEVAAAVERGEMDLDYQPILATDTLEVVGIEALARWDHPGRGRLPAGAFIAAAERGPAILPLTRLVLDRALAQQRALRDAGLADLRVWVNLAPRCLAWDGLVDAVATALTEAGVAPDRLVLELTEGAIAGARTAETRLAALRLLGVGIAIDDFGAGHSSLGRLRALPLDALKIDRAFVAGIAEDERDRAVVRTAVALADNLGLTAAAEGIETGEQLRAVRRLGCALAQGHLFARPMPAAELDAWLAAWRDRGRVGPEADLLLRDGEGG